MGGSSNSALGGFQSQLGNMAANNNIFQPLPYPSTGQAAQNAYSGIGGINQNPQGAYNLPTYANASSNLVNQGNATLGYAGQAYGAGNQAYGAGQNAFNLAPSQLYATVPQGQNLYNQGQQQYGQEQGVFNTTNEFANQALQQGFDPQNELYARNFAQNQQQAQAVAAMSGVAGTPYGAGVTNQANENFNLDWANQALQREATASQTAGNLYGAGTSALGQGMNAASQGLAGLQNAYSQGAANYGTLMGAGASAYGAGTGAYGAGSQALGAAGNAITQGGANQLGLTQANQNAQQQQIQDYLAYLQANTQNAQAWSNATNQTTGAGATVGNAFNYGNQIQQQGMNAGLGGLGSLAGNLGGYLIAGA